MDETIFEIKLHIKYWERCLKSLLPTQYTSNDSSRMTLGFFILSALDLLDEDGQVLLSTEKIKVRDWILKCQHPHGGFCGSPNHKFPDNYYGDAGVSGGDIDPANLPATYFAILSLGLMGDLRGVERIKCLRWLRKLQREDGSFGELLTSEGKIWGGQDMRYCYVATAIRWILKGDEEEIEDIDVERLVHHIRSSQTYDGGISESYRHESHAGYTYCALAALSFLNRLPKQTEQPTELNSSLPNISRILRWLASRQTKYQSYDEEKDDAMETELRDLSWGLADLYNQENPENKYYIGFNGRCSKQADTCYAFWVTASVNLLCEDGMSLFDNLASRRFLIEKTQHKIGGFGKSPGDPPDIYHSYLGLAALAMMNEPGLKKLDPIICVSIEQRDNIVRLRDELLFPTICYWNHGHCFSIRKDDPEYDKIMATKNSSLQNLT